MQTNALTNGKPALHLNAIARISITFSSPEGEDLVFRRNSECKGNTPWISEEPDCVDPIPARRPSVLPPPGIIHLHIRLGARLGHGLSGVIHAVEIVADKSSAELTEWYLPPLVVKISLQKREEDLEHECYNYETLQALQGSVIARCYGLFQSEVPGEATLLPLDEDTGWEEYELNTISGTVSILLLERLGEKIPMERELPLDAEDEVREMYDHLARLGVDHYDVRRSNILGAPLSSPPEFASLPSPHTQRVYRWRIIDFAQSCSANLTPELWNERYDRLVGQCTRAMRSGWERDPHPV